MQPLPEARPACRKLITETAGSRLRRPERAQQTFAFIVAPGRRPARFGIGADDDVSSARIRPAVVALNVNVDRDLDARAAQPQQTHVHLDGGRPEYGPQEIAGTVCQHELAAGAGIAHCRGAKEIHAGFFHVTEVQRVVHMVEGIEIAPTHRHHKAMNARGLVFTRVRSGFVGMLFQTRSLLIVSASSKYNGEGSFVAAQQFWKAAFTIGLSFTGKSSERRGPLHRLNDCSESRRPWLNAKQRNWTWWWWAAALVGSLPPFASSSWPPSKTTISVSACSKRRPKSVPTPFPARSSTRLHSLN